MIWAMVGSSSQPSRVREARTIATSRSAWTLPRLGTGTAIGAVPPAAWSAMDSTWRARTPFPRGHSYVLERLNGKVDGMGRAAAGVPDPNSI